MINERDRIKVRNYIKAKTYTRENYSLVKEIFISNFSNRDGDLGGNLFELFVNGDRIVDLPWNYTSMSLELNHHITDMNTGAELGFHPEPNRHDQITFHRPGVHL